MSFSSWYIKYKNVTDFLWHSVYVGVFFAMHIYEVVNFWFADAGTVMVKHYI